MAVEISHQGNKELAVSAAHQDVPVLFMRTQRAGLPSEDIMANPLHEQNRENLRLDTERILTPLERAFSAYAERVHAKDNPRPLDPPKVAQVIFRLNSYYVRDWSTTKEGEKEYRFTLDYRRKKKVLRRNVAYVPVEYSQGLEFGEKTEYEHRSPAMTVSFNTKGEIAVLDVRAAEFESSLHNNGALRIIEADQKDLRVTDIGKTPRLEWLLRHTLYAVSKYSGGQPVVRLNVGDRRSPSLELIGETNSEEFTFTGDKLARERTTRSDSVAWLMQQPGWQAIETAGGIAALLEEIASLMPFKDIRSEWMKELPNT